MIPEIIINQSFSNFLNKHEKIILKLFEIIKTFKKNIPNTYKYSFKYRPPRNNYKYTDKLFIGCILYIVLNNSSWTSFIGPIPGKQVHKKFKEYCKKGIFEKFFNRSVKEYLCTNSMEKTKLITVDTSTILNKNCKEINKRCPKLKNKKAIKISAIVDANSSPLSITLEEATRNDLSLFNGVFDKMINNNNIKDKINKDSILLADKGYDSKAIRTKIKKAKLKCVIGYNKRNTKKKEKIRELTENEKKIYKRRVVVEHYFGVIKKYPKINSIYEKSLDSYLNIILLVSSKILINRT